MLAASLLAAVGTAQVLTVNPGQSLQAAVDAAPDGALIWVNGGRYDPIHISGKSLTIYGGAQFTIYMPYYTRSVLFPLQSSSGGFRQKSGIEFLGTGTQTLALGNVVIEGETYGTPAEGGDAIRIDNAAWLYVLQGILLTPSSADIDVRQGQSGVDATRTGLIVFDTTAARGGESGPGIGWSSAPEPPGGTAILAPGIPVILLFSLVHGGVGSSGFLDREIQTTVPCQSRALGGEGGYGVESSMLMNVYSQVEGGQGGTVRYFIYNQSQPPQLVQRSCQQPNGIAWRLR